MAKHKMVPQRDLAAARKAQARQMVRLDPLPAPDLMLGLCSECGQKVYLARHTATHEWKPIDLEPHVYGNIELLPRDAEHRDPRYRYVSEDERAPAPDDAPIYHRAHAMSCPIGARWKMGQPQMSSKANQSPSGQPAEPPRPAAPIRSKDRG